MSKLYSLFITGICIHLSASVYSQYTEDDLKHAIKTGSSKSLSVFLGEEVEITIQTTQGVYKKTHAESLLKTFFTNYPPTDFKIIHQGTSKEGLKYLIGQYIHTKGTFQTVIFLKKQSTSYIIHTLQFNNE